MGSWRQDEGEAADGLRLEEADGGAGELAQFEGGKVLGLAAADEQQAFCLDAAGTVEHDGLEDLAGDFAAGDEFGGGILERLVGRGDAGVGLVLVAVIEHGEDETLGFELRGRGERELGIHSFFAS